LTEIKSQIGALEKRVEVQQREIAGSPENLHKEYTAAEAKLAQTKANVSKAHTNQMNLDISINKRKDQWQLFRKAMAYKTNEFFYQNLGRQGHSGKIEFDHKEQTLNLRVQTDSTLSDKQETTDTKSLSGGERSFTTLAFILALGESLVAPFRAVDEFDIFMDPIVRRISTKMLLEYAKAFKHKQFIFITPHDISFVDATPTCFIHKMKPPARGQRPLEDVGVHSNLSRDQS